MMPLPDTFASKRVVQFTFISPDPVTITFAFVAINFEESISPEPDTVSSNSFTSPLISISPEPDKVVFKRVALMSKLPSPEPVNTILKFGALIVFLVSISPDPANDTELISSNGIVIVIVDV
jgi:hypothetical protein